MEFAITFEADYLIRTLTQARVELDDGKLLTSIGLALLKKNDERHAADQAPDGTPWKPLKPATIIEKCKKSRSIDYKMLVEYGDMLRFYSRADRFIGEDFVTVGTVDRKAYWHHAGTKRGLPARPLVGFPDSDRRMVNLIVDDYLQVILHRLR